jgi:hypothetical protein
MANLTPELILALGGFITGILAFISSSLASKRAAKKDEVVLLREEVERLQNKNILLDCDLNKLRADYKLLFGEVLALRAENIWLKTLLVNKGVEIPPIPEVIHSDVPDTVK